MPSSPSLHELHYNLGHVLEQQGDFAGAIASYQQAIALQPNVVKAYNNLGCVLAKQGEFAAAIQVYQQAIALQPNSAILHSNLGQILSQQATDREMISAAIVAYRRAIALQPDLDLAHHGLGKLLSQQGQLAAAIEHFQQAMQHNPNHWDTVAEAAFAWIGLGDFDRAFSLLQSVIRAQQPFAQAYWQWTQQRGDRVSQPTDEWLQARIACERFLLALHQQQPTPIIRDHLADTYFYLGNVLTRYGGSGQAQQAQIYYDRVLQLQPDRLDTYLKLADCLLKQAQPNAAILIAHLGLARFPNSSLLHSYLGQILEQQQQFPAAIDHYQQALQSTHAQPIASRASASLHTHKISSLTPSPIAPNSPLQGFYASTQDWLNTHPAQANYRSLAWLRSTSTPNSLDKISNLACPPPVNSDCEFDRLTAITAPAVCHGLNCQPCLKRLFKSFQLTRVGNGIHRCTGLPPLIQPSSQPSPLFTVTIAQGKSWATPQQNDWLVCNAIAVFTPNDYLLADLSRDYPGQLPGCPHPPTQYQRLVERTLPPPTPIPGTVAVVTGLSGHNYYHWMVDILPRFALLQQSDFDIDRIDRIFLNSTSQSFQRATLTALGIPLEKILESDRQPHIQADRLLVPSFAGPLGWLELWAMNWLRQQFLPLAAPIIAKAKLPERIYISRDRASHRRVLNEAALIEQLQAYNFTVIQLESLSFAEQVALFAHAKLILAPHGGGLTNLIFCQPGTIVIELVSPAYIRHYYWVISQQRSLQHYLISGKPFAGQPLRQLMYPNPLLEDIWIDGDDLVEFLQTLRIG
jgi:capsular polysaccharide biosynthesis protein/tetratricopeptide (TPR) repeat protein